MWLVRSPMSMPIVVLVTAAERVVLPSVMVALLLLGFEPVVGQWGLTVPRPGGWPSHPIYPPHEGAGTYGRVVDIYRGGSQDVEGDRQPQRAVNR